MDQCIPLPADVDDITAAAIAIPGMSSWAAFKERAHLIAGENVLINGATGTSGRLAVQIAKYMGAKRVIATGRNVEALEQLMGIGADATVPLTRPAKELETAFKEQFGGEGVDVVLDYLWGQSAETLIMAAAKAGKDAVPIRSRRAPIELMRLRLQSGLPVYQNEVIVYVVLALLIQVRRASEEAPTTGASAYRSGYKV
jgi:NADPH:quinone reductase-like Zn-dependent oxidoreductase